MLKLTVEINGEDKLDIEDSLEEVLRLVREGYLSGKNNNENAGFVFEITECNE